MKPVRDFQTDGPRRARVCFGNKAQSLGALASFARTYVLYIELYYGNCVICIMMWAGVLRTVGSGVYLGIIL